MKYACVTLLRLQDADLLINNDNSSQISKLVLRRLLAFAIPPRRMFDVLGDTPALDIESFVTAERGARIHHTGFAISERLFQFRRRCRLDFVPGCSLQSGDIDPVAPLPNDSRRHLDAETFDGFLRGLQCVCGIA